MTISLEGTVARLQGDLTGSGMNNSEIVLLAGSLGQLETTGEKKLHIDCEQIRAADITGLQILYVWLQCARIRGVEPQLVNLPDALQHATTGWT